MGRQALPLASGGCIYRRACSNRGPQTCSKLFFSPKSTVTGKPFLMRRRGNAKRKRQKERRRKKVEKETDTGGKGSSFLLHYLHPHPLFDFLLTPSFTHSFTTLTCYPKCVGIGFHPVHDISCFFLWSPDTGMGASESSSRSRGSGLSEQEFR